MPMPPTGRVDRFFRALLRAFPFDFRAEYGRDMEQVFRAQHREARQEGTLRAVGRLWFDTVRDLATTAPREHVAMLRQDVVYALRALWRAPVFAAAAILTFALGIAAAAGVSIIINAFLFRPLPVVEPEQLISLSSLDQHVNLPHGVSFRDLQDYRAQKDVFVDLLGYAALPVSLSVGAGGERVTIESVTDNYFSLLGVAPALGRLIQPNEGRARGDAAVLVLAYDYWQSRFGGDPSVVGKPVRVNGKAVTIIGVASATFRGTEGLIRVVGYVPLWMTDSLTAGSGLERRDAHNLNAIARLQPGVTLERARAAMKTLTASLAREYPDSNTDVSLLIVPETHARPNPSIAPYFHTAAVAFAGLAALLLIVTSTNVANLLVARAATRGREVALRAALGARRGRLVRQFVTESVVLAGLGTTVAVPMAIAVTRTVERALSGATAEVTLRPDLAPDFRVLAITGLIALIAGIVAGLAPTFYALRTNLAGMLESGGRETASSARGRLRSFLVVAQVAISLALLVSAGLFVRSLDRARQVELGFNPDGLLLAATSPSMLGYDPNQLIAFYERARERAAAVPGVEHAAWISAPPFASLSSTVPNVTAEGQPPRADGQQLMALAARIGADYFVAAGTLVVEGRGFTATDDRNSRAVAVINGTLARQLWPGQSAIGRALIVGGNRIEVVGVVRDGRYTFVWEPPRPMLFRPLLQDVARNATLVIRTSRPPAELAATVRQAIHGADPDVPIYDVRSMVDFLNDGQAFLFFRLGALVAGMFGAMGVLLASVGLYGMVSYHVGQRTKEFGVRMALGAKATDIVRGVVSHGGRLALTGIAIGVIVAVGVARLLRTLLLDISPIDPPTYLAVGSLLLAICLAASFIPARRATSGEPLAALRTD